MKVSPTRDGLVGALAAGRFEHSTSPWKSAFYLLEERIGHALMRRPPPTRTGPQLLNLGCGTLRYPGWVNADQYAFKRRLRQRDFAPDWQLDITRSWRCPAEHWDGIFAQHVLEHVPYSAAVRVLEEALRTLKRGAWLRVSLPSLRRCADYYDARDGVSLPEDFPRRALAVSYLTQMHGHMSVWDAELLCDVLRELGFAPARETAFGAGADARLLMDQPDKRDESFYVEAMKP